MAYPSLLFALVVGDLARVLPTKMLVGEIAQAPPARMMVGVMALKKVAMDGIILLMMVLMMM